MAKKKTNLPVSADVNRQMQEDLATMRKRIQAPTGNSIRIKGKSFVLPDGRTATSMKAVIVDFINRNLFYTSKYDPDNMVPPDCFAIARDLDDMKPSPNATDKQSDNCKECPNNQFGSDGAGKACRNTIMLALLPPDADEDTPIMTLNVSPTALKNFAGYVAAVETKFQKPPYGVITEIAFDPSREYPSLRFGNPEINPDPGLAVQRRAEAQAILEAEPQGQAADGKAKPKRKRR